MIIYFSATGNCKHIANTIANETNDEIYSMITLDKQNNYTIKLDDNESLGFVIPTYFIGLPTLVEDFMSKINIISGDNSYVYVVSTYGTTPGYSTGYMKEYLEDIGIKGIGEYSIQTVDTWTVNFDLSTQEKIDKWTKNTNKHLDNTIKSIKDKRVGSLINRRMPKFIANIGRLMYDRARKTSHFHVNDDCICCKLCINDCQ